MRNVLVITVLAVAFVLFVGGGVYQIVEGEVAAKKIHGGGVLLRGNAARIHGVGLIALWCAVVGSVWYLASRGD